MPGGVGGVASRDAPLSRLPVAIAVAAPSPVPSFVPPVNLNSTGAHVPINAFATAPIYTSLTDVTRQDRPDNL